jgi:glycosyltransferase involved in cell wall biosynthesis
VGGLLSRKGKKKGTVEQVQLSVAPLASEDNTGRGIVAAMRQFVHRRILVPDPQVAWLPWALLRTLAIVRQENPEVIYSSSPPNSSQVLALWLKRIVNKPWVADLRDPWTEGVRRKQSYVNNRLRKRLEESWERAIALRADHFIVSTEKTAEQFVGKYPFLQSKLTVLTNGFDPVDFTHVNAGKKLLADGLFHLTLTGNVETMFDAIPFFQAVKELVTEQSDVGAHLRVNFVGTRRSKYDTFIRENALDRQVQYVGYVPHADSVQYLADSDVLFLCQIPEYESAGIKLPGKLFEYLYLRKPVLALTLPGVTTDILQRAGLGVVINPNDVSGIKEALRDLYGQWRTQQWRFVPDEVFINTFDRARLTERLAVIFEMVTNRPDAGAVGRKESASVNDGKGNLSL